MLHSSRSWPRSHQLCSRAVDGTASRRNCAGIFAPTLSGEQLLISQLQPLEDLLNLMQPVVGVSLTTLNSLGTALSQWFENVFDTGWQAVESLLVPPEAGLAFHFRKAAHARENISNDSESIVRRAKLIDLGTLLAEHPIAIVVELKAEANHKTSIRLQVHLTRSHAYLPPLVQLMVLDETGVIFLEAKSRHADNYIQLQFRGKPGERFSIKAAFGGTSITEYFVI